MSIGAVGEKVFKPFYYILGAVFCLFALRPPVPPASKHTREYILHLSTVVMLELLSNCKKHENIGYFSRKTHAFRVHIFHVKIR